MTIELTPEQTQAVQDHPEGPIAVVDPTSQREYVLMSREQYDQLQGSPLIKHPAGRTPPVPQRLADLPTPPEVAEEARRQYAQRRWWDRRSLNDFENAFKLQYYYGGHWICYLRSKQGLEIVIVHNGDDEEFHRQYRALSPEQRVRAACMCPRVWKDDTTELSWAFYSYESDH
jgi:hypothetical protein